MRKIKKVVKKHYDYDLLFPDDTQNKEVFFQGLTKILFSGTICNAESNFLLVYKSSSSLSSVLQVELYVHIESMRREGMSCIY